MVEYGRYGTAGKASCHTGRAQPTGFTSHTNVRGLRPPFFSETFGSALGDRATLRLPSLRLVEQAAIPAVLNLQALRRIRTCGVSGRRSSAKPLAPLLVIGRHCDFRHFEVSAQRANLQPRRSSNHAGTPSLDRFGKYIQPAYRPCTTHLSAFGGFKRYPSLTAQRPGRTIGGRPPANA
ncbi:hypothetical protein SCOR_34955 [Sulfidibacter corallicola]